MAGPAQRCIRGAEPAEGPGRRFVIDEFFELYDQDATAANIRRLFVESLPKKIGAADSLLIFYAGHGQLDASKTGFWIASDATTDQFDQSGWLGNAQLRNMIGGLKAQRILVLADACFSGDFLNVHRGAAPVINSAYYQKALQLTARQVLTSGSSTTVPDDSEFGRQLLNLLERYDEPLLNPVAMYERIRRGVTQTLPLLGTLPGNEEGASFVLFRKSAKVPSPPVDSAPSPAPPVAVVAKNAELMVSASMDGAEILVDGVSMGKAPVLLQKLASGRTIRVEARSGDFAGSVDMELKPGELHELSIALSRRKGNLFVAASEKDLRLVLDRQDKGPLATGLFRDLPAGAHELELVGSDLYWRASVRVPGDETARIEAKPWPIGSIEVSAPMDASISVSGPGGASSLRGGEKLDRLGLGSYDLVASGPGYTEVRQRVEVKRGQVARWTPWTSGSVAVSLEPRDARLRVQEISGADLMKLPPGSYRFIAEKEGYHEASAELAVAVGKTASLSLRLEQYAPGSLVLVGLPLNSNVRIDGQLVPLEREASGNTRVDKISAGIAHRLEIQDPRASSLEPGTSVFQVNLKEGENLPLLLRTGTIAIPWMPEGGTVLLGSDSTASTIALQARKEGEATRYESPSLLPGSYTVSLQGPRSYTGSVTIEAGKASIPAAYRETMLLSLQSDLKRNQKKLTGRKFAKTAGWISLGTGILGAAGSATAYFMGKQAMDEYWDAPSTADALDARERAQSLATIFTGSLITAGVGLGLSPLLFFVGPDPDALKRSMDSLDEQIKALGN